MHSCGNRDNAAVLPRGRRSSNATTIADILQAAKQEFAAFGFDSATVDSISRRAGVSKQLLYYYFGSKAELYSLILSEAAAGTSSIVDTADYRNLPPEQALASFIEKLFSEYVDRPQICKMSADEVQHNFAHVGRSSPLWGVMRKIIDDLLGEIVERGCQQGVFRADIKPDNLFWMIFSLVTTWYAHSSFVVHVSSAGGESALDAAAWRANSIQFVLAAISSKVDQTASAVPAGQP